MLPTMCEALRGIPSTAKNLLFILKHNILFKEIFWIQKYSSKRCEKSVLGDLCFVRYWVVASLWPDMSYVLVSAELVVYSAPLFLWLVCLAVDMCGCFLDKELHDSNLCLHFFNKALINLSQLRTNIFQLGPGEFNSVKKPFKNSHTCVHLILYYN
jgi:hypothetical protein